MDDQRRTHPVVRFVVTAGVIAAITAALARWLRGPSTPAFDEPSIWPPAEPWPPLTEADAGVDATWKASSQGACPDGYPVKAKVRSGLYHEPGMIAYERTNADRCYPDAATAEADGFTRAKR